MKTNLEELNYRFRKELLNNYGYKLYFELIASIYENARKTKFNYSAYAKGLFKTDDKDDFGLVEFLEANEINPFDDNVYWGDPYHRHGGSIDFIDMKEVCSSWVFLQSQFYNQDLDKHPKLWKILVEFLMKDHFKSDSEISGYNIEIKYK